MSFPRYPNYKDSGVEWLGEVPEHWAVMPLKRIASLKSGDSITSERIREEGDFPVFGGNGIRGFTDGFTHEGHHVVLGRQGALCGNVNYASGKFWASEHAVVARPLIPAITRWLGEMLRSMNLNQYSVTAAQPGLSMEFVGNLRSIVPPLPEQTAIAAFLDRETAKIDALIAEQQRLIDLLQEKRQAVISHVVTKGLNPDAPMKDSGIEWLGQVPEHWKAIRLRWLFRQAKRQDQTDKQVLSVYRDYGVILKDSRDDNLNKTPEDLSTYQLVERNDLVVNKMKAWQGSLGISPYEGVTSPDYVVFSPTHRENPLFLHSLLRDRKMADVYRSISNGIRPSQWRLEPDQFLGLAIFLPPTDEQQTIVAALDRTELRYGPLIAESTRAIALLQERRSALISAAVTGQIDVRGLAGSEAA
jgi:type I restriction enzyme S subunit